MPRVATLTVLLLLAMATAPVGQAPTSSPPSFTQVVAAPTLAQMGEPSLFVDASVTPARVWATAPGFGVYGSTDGGASFGKFANGPFDTPVGVQTSGDASMARDADGTLYITGLDIQNPSPKTVLPVQVSHDQGHTWSAAVELLPGAVGIDCDRQWIAARGHGEAIESVNCASGSETIYRTTDGGATWTGPFTLTTEVCVEGPITTASDGAWILLYDDCSDVVLLRSVDGVSWTRTVVGPRSSGIHFPVVASDAVGTLYAAWDDCVGAEHAQCRIYEARSADRGQTWTPRQAVSASGRSAIFPWLAAGAAGKVDLAYYQESAADPVGVPDTAPPTTTWDVVLAQSLNANATIPLWTATIAAAKFHTGSICTSGLACVGPQNVGLLNAPTPFDRRVYDFFEMRIDASGNALIAYPRDVPATLSGRVSSAVIETVFTYSDLMVARQTGGMTIT